MDDKTVVLNAAKINYDGKIDFSGVASRVEIYGDTSPEQILGRVAGFRVVVTKELRLDSETIARFPDSVKLICEAGTGYNNIDLPAARAKGIAVCNIPAYSTQRVAHTAILLMLGLSSSMQRQQAMLTRGDHSNFTRYLQADHVELNGKTLGIIGAGNIGREVMKIARAMGMNLLVYTRTPCADSEGVHYVSLDEVLRNSDYLSLHCPLTEQTHHILDAKALAKMKPSAFLINTSRGGLIDETALIEALQSGRIAGAGLDVQENEPPAEENPLYSLENVILTPHMGWKGLETRRRLVERIGENIQAFAAGNPINRVC
jgi:glycerate dehydrogenase